MKQDAKYTNPAHNAITVTSNGNETASAATPFIAHRMPLSMCYAILRQMRHCSLDEDAPELGDPDVTCEEGSSTFDMIVGLAYHTSNFSSVASLCRAEFFGGGDGPQIVLHEYDSDMVHLITARASERMVRLAKALLDEAYADLNGKAA